MMRASPRGPAYEPPTRLWRAPALTLTGTVAVGSAVIRSGSPGRGRGVVEQKLSRHRFVRGTVEPPPLVLVRGVTFGYRLGTVGRVWHEVPGFAFFD